MHVCGGCPQIASNGSAGACRAHGYDLSRPSSGAWLAGPLGGRTGKCQSRSLTADWRPHLTGAQSRGVKTCSATCPPRTLPPTGMNSTSSPFTLLLRVRYGECDAQHVVFNARYGDYADIAMTEFLRALVGGYDKLLAAGIDTQVVRLATDFRSPARFDEVLAITVETSSIGNTSFTLTMQMALHPSGRAVATTTASYVMVTAKTHQKMRVPEDIRNLLHSGAPGIIVNQAGILLGSA